VCAFVYDAYHFGTLDEEQATHTSYPYFSISVYPWESVLERSRAMTIEQMGSIGEVIGGIAVLVTLIYLAIQMRQNTQMMRAAAHHSVNELGVHINLALGTDPEASRVLQLGSENYKELDPHQRLMFHLMMRANFSGAEDFYIQAREGLLDIGMWESRKLSMTRYLLQPGVQIWWGRNRDLFSPDFVKDLSGDS
jgi:hypothetical protein